MQTEILMLVVLVFGSSSASVQSSIGPCNRNIIPDTTMDFKEFASENDGQWSEVWVPSSSSTEGMQSISYNLKPTGNEDEYDLVMTYVTENGDNGTFSEEVMTYLGNSSLTCKGSVSGEDFTLKTSFIKYEPGCFAYYYICSDYGLDTAVDYRYVLAHENLSKEKTDEISIIDKMYGFKGDLKTLSLS